MRAPSRGLPTRADTEQPLRLGPFVRRLSCWMLLLAPVWGLATPAYNAFLIAATGQVVALTESPDQSRIARGSRDDLVVFNDAPALRARRTSLGGGWVWSVRVTDVHFPLILLAALFLAVPETGLGRRLRALGRASLIAALFHLISLLFAVKFGYATQMGSYSLETYSAIERNFWGLGRHLVDLPFKLALPFMLWMLSHYHLVAAHPSSRPS